MQIIGKSEYQTNLNFEKNESAHELTNLSLREKEIITDILIDHGLPVNSENKDDYNFIKTELQKHQGVSEPDKSEADSETIKIDLNQIMDLKDENGTQAEKNVVANIERFVTRLRMVAQQIIQQADEEPEQNFDPDSDGFQFGLKEAELVHKNINILQFVRRNLGMSSKCK